MVKDFSPKAWDYIYSTEGFKVEILEGTTWGGKTENAIMKHGLCIANSPYPAHIFAAVSGGKAEDLAKKFCDTFPMAQYYGKGDRNVRLSHIKFLGKIIYVLGYKTKSAYSLIRGKNDLGLMLLDEVNLCHPTFFHEASIRANKFLTATTNPDDPRLPVFLDFINHARPYKKYEKDVPREIMTELEKATPNPQFKYWFFSFEDNLAATPEIIERKKAGAVPGTQQYKNLILGLRGKATGLVFPNFTEKNIIHAAELKQKIDRGEIEIAYISCGVDTSFSGKSDDLSVMVYQLITTDRRCFVVDELAFNNRDLSNPMAVSDLVKLLIDFLDRNSREWGFCRDVFVESADQATNQELAKYNRLHPTPYNFVPSYKKVQVIDRIRLMLSWIHTGDYIVCDHCKVHIAELQGYAWDESKPNTPMDFGDHSINASQYGWIPYRGKIGRFGED